MKAIVLAAGRGERMRPLTDHCPKPLLQVRGKPLIEWHLEALARAGVTHVVINTAWLEDQIVAALGDGSRFGLAIVYSMEGRDHGGALETAGGLKKALPLLRTHGARHLLEDNSEDCFWYVAADVFAPEFHFDAADAHAFCGSDLSRSDFSRGDVSRREPLAQLWMVPNPPQHPTGDFAIHQGLAAAGVADEPRYTWSGIGLFRAAFVHELMADLPAGTRAPLRPYLDRAIAQGRLAATLYTGPWADIGTPERLAEMQVPGAC